MKNSTTFIAGSLLAATSLFAANTPLLVNTDFATWDKWILGSNKFQPVTTWKAFVSAPEAYSYDSRVKSTANGFTFYSWDDGASDKLENYVFQEFKAGPPTGAWPTIFKTGDKIVFKGTARSTKTGANTSDVVTRAFIKTLGYNEVGWEFQTKQAYSAFYDVVSTAGSFDLSVTYPDITVDDSLQVIQIGFEITTLFDGTAMDGGTIEFSNLEAYVEGTGPDTWLGYTVLENDIVDTGKWLGYVSIAYKPWIYSLVTNNFMFIDESFVSDGGGWVYVLK